MPDIRILKAMLSYAERNRPEDIPEIKRRIVNWQLNQGPLNIDLSARHDEPLTHLDILPFAIEAAMQSPCFSSRGVAIWDRDGLISTGFNHQPKPFICDRSADCKRTCGKTAVHAEQSALLHATRSVNGAHMLHIKVMDGKPVASDGPSCLQCSKLMLSVGITGMWLLLEHGWRFYASSDFHYKSCLASGIPDLRWPGTQVPPEAWDDPGDPTVRRT